MLETTLDTVRTRALPDAEGRFGGGSAAAIALGFIGVASVIAVSLPGVQNDPKRFVWYRRLDKPRATPPDPVFGLAWPVIELALAFAAGGS